MRIIIFITIILHGLIHVFGFLKAFHYHEFNVINPSISKANGIIWLMTFILFISSAVMMIFHKNYWWFLAWSAILLSQILIFRYWTDAKFGTFLNILILIYSIIAFSEFNFKKLIKSEQNTMLQETKINSENTIEIEKNKALPPVVLKWLKITEAIEHPRIHNVYLKQSLNLKLKPEQEDWYKGEAEQYFSVDPIGFHWNINTSIKGIINVRGRDKFEHGRGEMMIKVLSSIPVVNVKENEKINQATLQRYLAEIVWFPSAATMPYITWKQLDGNSAKATLSYEGIDATGVFHFNEKGLFQKFSAMRYRDIDDSELTEWIVEALKTEKRNGIYIPVSCKASWKLEDNIWTWLKLDIDAISYNVNRHY